MKNIFVTWCTDDYKDKLGIDILTKQLNYFHPNIKHIIIDTKKTEELRKKYPWAKSHHMMPICMIEYFDEYDSVIYIDADTTIVGNLNEVFDENYEIMCVRNYALNGQAGITPPNECIVPCGFNTNNFINAGFNVIKSKKIVEEWLNNCSKLTIYDDEQNELNRIFNSGKYKTKILDDLNTKVSYGVSNVFGLETHWDSWKNLYIKNNEIYQMSPLGEEIKIKVLHMAGGGYAKDSIFRGKNMREWLSEWLPIDVVEYIKYISK